MNFCRVIVLLSLVFSLQAQSSETDFNQSCRQAYNTAYEDLRNAVYNFEIDYINNIEFATIVTAISTGVTTARAVCSLIEDPGNKKCVELYQNRYNKLRDKINVGSLLFNQQKKVKWSVVEDIGSEFSNLFYSLRCQ